MTGESGERDSGLRHAEAATAAQAGRGEDAARCGSTYSKVSLLKDGIKRIQEDSTTKDMKGTKKEEKEKRRRRCVERLRLHTAYSI